MKHRIVLITWVCCAVGALAIVLVDHSRTETKPAGSVFRTSGAELLYLSDGEYEIRVVAGRVYSIPREEISRIVLFGEGFERQEENED